MGEKDNSFNFNSLRDEVFKLIPNYSKINDLPVYEKNISKYISSDFISEEISIRQLDYFYTNYISRASKTMSECRQIKQNIKRTGTNN